MLCVQVTAAARLEEHDIAVGFTKLGGEEISNRELASYRTLLLKENVSVLMSPSSFGFGVTTNAWMSFGTKVFATAVDCCAMLPRLGSPSNIFKVSVAEVTTLI